MGEQNQLHAEPPRRRMLRACFRPRRTCAVPRGGLEVLRRELHAVTSPPVVDRRPPDAALRWWPPWSSSRGQLRGARRLRLHRARLRRARTPASPARVAGASFIAYAVANNVGFAMLSGASVRYRFYTRWGMTAAGPLASSSRTRSRSGWAVALGDRLTSLDLPDGACACRYPRGAGGRCAVT